MNTEILKKLGDRIRMARDMQKITQEELAERAGLHRTYIGMIERGEKNITILSLEKVSKALGLSLSNLINGL